MATKTVKPRTTKRAQETPTAASPRAIYVLSDSTGNLARHMLAAFLTQFPSDALSVRFETFVRTSDRLGVVLELAKEDGAAVCHAMISDEFKQFVDRFCDQHAIACRDLTGGLVEFLSGVAGVSPRQDVTALHPIDRNYKRRIGALEFTLNHDDGLGLGTIHEADIVLAGVSRTSKTPTSIYLAQQGYRVANVSLALGIDPPRQLLELPSKKVVGLTINAAQLVLIRTHRQNSWRMGDTNYGDPDYVARELTWSRRLFMDRGWNTINVTDQAIEETSARAIELAGLAADTLSGAADELR